MEKTTLKEKKDFSIQRIMDAAMETFAEAGFSGARVDEIAKRAGINKAMIYYRIGDKKTLYTEVLHKLFGSTVLSITRKVEKGGNPEEKLRIYIQNVLSIVEKHPYISRLMMWELASGGYNFPDVAADDLSRLLHVLMKILEEGIDEGLFIKINPLIPHMMSIGTMILYKGFEPLRARYQSVYSTLFGEDKKFSRYTATQIEDLVLKAVKK